MLGSILGSVINAGAGLLGAAMAPQPRPREDFRKVFNEKMAMGQQHGISKLVMAGTPVPLSQPADNAVGQAVANMGADIGNVVSRAMTAPQKQAQAIALENAAAQNELIKAQTRSINMRTIRESVPPRPPVMTGVPAHRGPLPPPRIEPPASTTHLQWGGKNYPIPPGYSDTATATNVIGEGADFLWGPPLAYQTARHNFPYLDHWTYMGMMNSLYQDAMKGGVRSTGRDTYVPLDRRKAYRGY